MSSVVFERYESNVRSYCRNFPAVLAHAEGAWVSTIGGHRYLDFLTGAGSLNYGHNPKPIMERVVAYINQRGILQSLDLHTEAKGAFIETFQRTILRPRRLDYRMQFPGPTGTNAVEAALKIARKVTGRNTVVAFSGGYHGMSLGSLAATTNPDKRAAAGVALQNVSFMPYDGYLGPDCATLPYIEAMLSRRGSGVDQPAAILVELVQGEGGLNTASVEWLRGVQTVCREIGALLIVDDIQAGCGRTGNFFSFEGMDLSPDIVTLSKSLSGFGTPFSLVLLRPDIDQWSPGEHNGTFRGNNLAFVGGKAAIDLFWSDHRLTDAVARLSSLAKETLRAIVDRLPPGFVRMKGRGLMLGLEFADLCLAEAVSSRLFERGVIVETCGVDSRVLKLLPPLTISEEDLGAGLELLSETVDELFASPRAAVA